MSNQKIFICDKSLEKSQPWGELLSSSTLGHQALGWGEVEQNTLKNSGLFCFDFSDWAKLEKQRQHKIFKTLNSFYKLISVKNSELKDWQASFLAGDEKALIFDPEADSSYNQSILKSLIRSVNYGQNEELLRMGAGLSDLVTRSLKELQRVKKLHETLVPLRVEKTKGLSVSSKFAVGESSGGEFYDVIKGEQEIVVILSHSDSYVASGLVLSCFEELRQKKEFNLQALQRFSLQVGEVVESELGKEGLSGLELFIARVDMKSLKIEGLNWGRSQLISLGNFFVGENTYPVSKSFAEKVIFSDQLDRSQRYLVVSPGLRLNSQDLLGQESLISASKHLLNQGATKLFDEVFYQLKKQRSSSFLKYDATCVYIEVDPNVIVQI